jgi:NAD(P)-dependent dehydrogenase (short-subunit alcohol dehydrogenase family)
VAAQIKELGQTASVHAMDVTDHEQVRNLAEGLQGKPVDLLVN